MSFIMYTNLLVLTTSYLIFIIFHFSVGSSLCTTIFELLKSLKVNQSKKDTNRENPNFEFFFWTQIFVYPPKIILYLLHIYTWLQPFKHQEWKRKRKMAAFDWALIFAWCMFLKCKKDRGPWKFSRGSGKILDPRSR